MQGLSFCKCRLCAEGICDDLYQVYIDPNTKNVYYNNPITNNPEYISFNLPTSTIQKIENITTTTNTNDVSIINAIGFIPPKVQLVPDPIIISNNSRVDIPFTDTSEVDIFKLTDGYLEILPSSRTRSIILNINLYIINQAGNKVTLWIVLLKPNKDRLKDLSSASILTKELRSLQTSSNFSHNIDLSKFTGYFISIQARSNKVNGAEYNNVANVTNHIITPGLLSNIYILH